MNRQHLAEPVRQALKRLPDPYAAHYGVVPGKPPEGAIPLGDAAAKLDAATQAMAKADTIAALLPSHFLLSRILVRQEALSSSAIEDTHSTLDALLTIEETEDGEAFDGEPAQRTAAKQVRDYAVALEDALRDIGAQGHDAFTTDLIADLHRSVMANDATYADPPGELRTIVNWIGGGQIARSTFNPPPPEDVPACLRDNIDYLRCLGQQVMTQHLVTRMALAHAHFEAVHPFRDGNGRVGRLLLPLMMAADGRTPLYLSPFIASEKDRYYRSLRMAQQRLDYVPLIEFLAEAIVGTVAEAESAKRALDDVMASWGRRRTFRRGSAAHRALDLLPGFPIVDVGRLASRLGVSFQAANRAVQQLAVAGILAPRSPDGRSRRRNRVFAAEEVLAIYNRRFGD